MDDDDDGDLTHLLLQTHFVDLLCFFAQIKKADREMTEDGAEDKECGMS